MRKQKSKNGGQTARSEKTSKAQKQAKSSQRAEARAQNNSSGTELAGVAVATKNTTKNAKIEYAKDGKTCLVVHRERFATILGSVAFASTAFAINPGQSATFPWLSGVANRFESYRFEQLQFEFKTKTATTALGDVILAVDYDATDAAPSDSIQAEAYDETASAAPWQNVSHYCKKINLHKLPMFYVRGDTQPATTDLKMSDMGNLFVCTENQANANLVGYMYVSYSVRFFTPQLRSNDIMITGGKASGLTTMTAANPFGTAGSFDASARGVTINGASRFTFANPGTYIVSAVLVGSVLSAHSATAGSNLTVTAISGIANGGATTYVTCFIVVSTASNAYFDFAATATTVTTALLYVGSAPFEALALAIEELRKEMLKDPSRKACIERMRLRVQKIPADCPSGCWCGPQKLL